MTRIRPSAHHAPLSALIICVCPPPSPLSAGNALTNECISEILSCLSLPDAPRINNLDFSCNAMLTWRAALPIVLAMGLPAVIEAEDDDDQAVAAVSMPSIDLLKIPIVDLRLR